MDIDKMIQKLKAKEMHYFEEAEAFRAITETGISQHDLAKRLDLKQTTISNKVRLLKLLPEVRQAVKENNLSERHARALLKIPDYKCQMKIIDHIGEFSLTVKEAEEYIDKQLRLIACSGNLNEFIRMIANCVRSLKSQGINIKSGKNEKEGYTDIVIRFYK